jgi:catechol 2,3-dioxygenase-like lactoylglutathione lyase family enzyme
MSDLQIQKVKVKRLAHVGLWTSDSMAQARFYRQVLGLDLHATSEGALDPNSDIEGVNLFFGLGEEHHCIGLYSDTRPILTNARKPIQPPGLLHHLSFEVDTAAELAALAARLRLSNIDLSLEANDGYPDAGDALWFDDPDGNHISIAVTAGDLLTYSPPISPAQSAQRAAPRPYGLQHVALYTPHLEAMVDFYTDALGFDISDWLLRERVWLRCNSNHHTILFIQGQPSLEHIGFGIPNSVELLRWADYLSQQRVPLLWGPGRHGAGNDLFIRFADAEGLHIELSAEMTQYYDRDVTTPPRLWHTRTTALNLWGTLPFWIKEDVQA